LKKLSPPFTRKADELYGVPHLWPFTQRTFLEVEDERWLLDTWAWMLRNVGGLKRLRASPLVDTSRVYFPPTSASGHERAEHIFACVKKLAGMSDWPCRLVPQAARVHTRIGELAVVKIESGDLPVGTFSVSQGEVTITYDPATVTEPAKLVATLAHELSHYLLHTVQDELPGGEEMHEFATDLMAVYLGFGLFTANQAFNFRQHGDAFSQGWQTSGLGYLRERDWAFALAIFSNLRDEPISALRTKLKPHLYSDVVSASRYLNKRSSVLAAMRST
jgi:hypothetical protein